MGIIGSRVSLNFVWHFFLATSAQPFAWEFQPVPKQDP